MPRPRADRRADRARRARSSAIRLLAGGLVLLGLAPAVHAQVTLDLHALDQGPTQPAKPRAEQHPLARRPASRHITPSHHPPAEAGTAPDKQAPGQAPGQAKTAPEQANTAPAQTRPAPPQAPQPPAANLPTGVPAPVALAPIVVQPGAKVERPLPPPISDTAGGRAEPVPDGLRILFSPERADLTPATESAIKSYLGTILQLPATSFNVVAYAAGPPEDPSTPRRLSLSRALAIRSVLLAEGIDSPHIYLRALGAASGEGPPDRVDISALGTNTGSAEKPK